MDKPKFKVGDKVLIFRDSYPVAGSEKFIGNISIIRKLDHNKVRIVNGIEDYTYSLDISYRFFFLERDLRLVNKDNNIKCRNKI